MQSHSLIATALPASLAFRVCATEVMLLAPFDAVSCLATAACALPHRLPPGVVGGKSLVAPVVVLTSAYTCTQLQRGLFLRWHRPVTGAASVLPHMHSDLSLHHHFSRLQAQ